METNTADEKKEVSLTLSSDAEAKALSRGTTRRRRGRKAALGGGDEGILVERSGAPEVIPAPAPVVPTYAPAPAPVPAAPIVPVVAAAPAVAFAPAPTMSTTTAVGGGAQPVKFQAKRSAASLGPPPAPAGTVAPTAAAPKILLHKKRISSAPAAQTLKKPKFVVSAATAAPSHAPISGGKTRRKFAERSISITVKPAAQTRRMRRTLKNRIHTMPIGAVRKYLLRKGVLKPKATAPPEDMMRSMMRDYLLLHAAE